ncbi:hypothetical protein VP01_5554g1, partial [Puccinia sorghi]
MYINPENIKKKKCHQKAYQNVCVRDYISTCATNFLSKVYTSHAESNNCGNCPYGRCCDHCPPQLVGGGDLFTAISTGRVNYAIGRAGEEFRRSGVWQPIILASCAWRLCGRVDMVGMHQYCGVWLRCCWRKQWEKPCRLERRHTLNKNSLFLEDTTGEDLLGFTHFAVFQDQNIIHPFNIIRQVWINVGKSQNPRFVVIAKQKLCIEIEIQTHIPTGTYNGVTFRRTRKTRLIQFFLCILTARRAKHLPGPTYKMVSMAKGLVRCVGRKKEFTVEKAEPLGLCHQRGFGNLRARWNRGEEKPYSENQIHTCGKSNYSIQGDRCAISGLLEYPLLLSEIHPPETSQKGQVPSALNTSWLGVTESPSLMCVKYSLVSLRKTSRLVSILLKPQ